MTELQRLEFEGLGVRVLDRDGNPWFALSDACDVLGISNSRDAASKLDDDEKGVANTDTLGGPQQITIVNESGLYSLILRSRKPAAKRFKKWVTSEVLPSIRKTGSYGLTQVAVATLPAFPIDYDTLAEKIAEKSKAANGRAAVYYPIRFTIREFFGDLPEPKMAKIIRKTLTRLKLREHVPINLGEGQGAELAVELVDLPILIRAGVEVIVEAFEEQSQPLFKSGVA